MDIIKSLEHEQLKNSIPDLKVGNTIIETITISEADAWRKTFTDLPKYQNGQEIQYIVSERPVDGYTLKNITGDKVNGFTITNTYTPIPLAAATKSP